MKDNTSLKIAEHNQYQLKYFESTLKKSMIPVATPYIHRQVTEVVRLGNLKAEDRVLEVGCGMGRYTLPLAEKGVRIEGLDLSPVLLDRLREYNAGRFEIPLYSADLLATPKDLEGAFDAVIGFFVLHHLHDLDACFAAMARLLKPRGRMIFLEPNPFNPLYYLQVFLTPRMNWKAERGMTQMRRGIIFNSFAAVGLGRQIVERFGFFPPYIANLRWGARLERILERFPLWSTMLPFQLFKGEIE